MTTLLDHTFTAAETGQVGGTFACEDGLPKSLLLLASFDYGSGGTSVTAYVQTKIGDTWVDVCTFQFTTSDAAKVANLSALTPVTTLYTPTDGSLTANTVKDGILGRLWRVKYTSVGDYAGGTRLVIDAYFNGALNVRRIV